MKDLVELYCRALRIHRTNTCVKATCVILNMSQRQWCDLYVEQFAAQTAWDRDMAYRDATVAVDWAY